MTMYRNHRLLLLLRVLFVAVAAITCATCILPTDLDRPGARMVRRMSSFPAWSTDSKTVFFSDRAGSGVTRITINAVDVASGHTRRLATVMGLNHGEQLRTGPDPSIVYASIAHPDWSLNLTIYRIPVAGGTAETVTSNVGTPWFEISQSGSHFAYKGSTYTADTVYVTPVAAGNGAPVALPTVGRFPRVLSLSPNGSQVLYSSIATSEIQLASVNGGTHRLVHRSVAGQVDAVAPQVQWLGNVPHLLMGTDSTPDADGSIVIYDLNGSTGERTPLARIGSPVPEAAAFQLARSFDGRSFAAWVPVAIVNKNVERTTYRYRLYVRTARDAEPKSMLEWSADQPLTWFEFSPDGNRLALLLTGSLHVVQLD